MFLMVFLVTCRVWSYVGTPSGGAVNALILAINAQVREKSEHRPKTLIYHRLCVSLPGRGLNPSPCSGHY